MPDPAPKRKRKRRPRPPEEFSLTPEQKFTRARTRSLELSRQYLGQPEPQQPVDPLAGLDDLSTPELQLATVLNIHADPGACPPPYLLFAAYQDVLGEENSDVIRDHSEDCVLCQVLLAELAPSEHALPPAVEARIRAQIPDSAFDGEDLPELKPLPPLRRLLLWPLVGAATVIVICVIGWFAYQNRRPATPPVAAPPPSPTTTSSQAPILNAPELTRIGPLPPPTDLPTTAVNDGGGVPLPTVTDLADAFQTYTHGEYSDAAAQFRILANNFPSSEVPPLYLGVAELELNENTSAQHDLDKAHQLATPTRTVETSWYLAVADLRIGLQSEALPLLQSICAMTDNIHHDRACAISAQLGAH